MNNKKTALIISKSFWGIGLQFISAYTILIGYLNLIGANYDDIGLFHLLTITGITSPSFLIGRYPTLFKINKKTFIILSYLLVVPLVILFLLSQNRPSLTLAQIINFSFASILGFYLPINSSFIENYLDKKNYNNSFSTIYFFQFLFSVLGLIFVNYYFLQAKDKLTLDDYSIVFLISSISFLLSACSLHFLKTSKQQDTKRDRILIIDFLRREHLFIRNRVMLFSTYLGMSFFVKIGLTNNIIFLTDIVLLAIIMKIGSALSFKIYGKIADKHGYGPVVAIGALSASFALLLITIEAYEIFFISSFLFGLADSSLILSQNNILIKRAKSHERTSQLGLGNFFIGLLCSLIIFSFSKILMIVSYKTLILMIIALSLFPIYHFIVKRENYEFSH